jgi:branched-chain amino acid transport system substrate-binding protein
VQPAEVSRRSFFDVGAGPTPRPIRGRRGQGRAAVRPVQRPLPPNPADPETWAVGEAVLKDQVTTDKATDFNAILTTIKGKKPDVVFFGGMDAVAGPMLRQMKQLGIEAKFVGGDGICSGELPKLAAGTMADGQVVCAEAGGVEGAAKKSMEDFYAAFKKKYNTDVQVYAPYVYDAVNVMVAAMVKAGSAEPAKYLPVLAKTEGYKGVTGTIGFDSKGDVKNGALTLYTYKGGKRDQIAVVR